MNEVSSNRSATTPKIIFSRTLDLNIAGLEQLIVDRSRFRDRLRLFAGKKNHHIDPFLIVVTTPSLFRYEKADE